MKRIFVTYILLFALPFYFGCSTLQPINQESWSQIVNTENSTDEIVIWTKDGYRYPLIWETVTVSSDTLSGSGYRMKGNKEVEFRVTIAIDNIKKIETDQFDLELTIILFGLITILGIMFLLMAAEGMKSSVSGIQHWG
jgi:hypothetical protein